MAANHLLRTGGPEGDPSEQSGPTALPVTYLLRAGSSAHDSLHLPGPFHKPKKKRKRKRGRSPGRQTGPASSAHLLEPWQPCHLNELHIHPPHEFPFWK